MVASANSIAEIGAAAKTAPPERGERVFKQLTTLFLANADRFGEAEIGVLDDALVSLVGGAEAGSLAELSEALSKKELVPPKTIRSLAFHADARVACPVLRNSSRLEAEDL